MRCFSPLIASLSAGFSIILSAPASALITVGALDTPDSAWDVEVVGDLAYAVTIHSSGYEPYYYSSLRVIDVSNPALPVELGSLDIPGRASNVEVVGGLAYITVTRWISRFPRDSSGRPIDWSLRVIDVSNPAALVELGGGLITPGVGHGVEVMGQFAYVVGARMDSDGRSIGGYLRVIDVSNPALPEERSSLDTLDIANDVAVVSDLAYLAASSSGLFVIDVSNPTFPIEVGALDTPGFAYDVEVVGDLAYVADGLVGLRILDVSNPFLPVEIGALDTPGFAADVAVAGDLAYVITRNPTHEALRVIDVSNPTFPVEIGGLAMLALDVEVVGDLAYVAASVGSDSGTGSLRIVDVSNPTFPLEVGALDMPLFTFDVEVVGNLAYVVRGPIYGGTGSLRIVDVSNPTFPVEVGALDTPGLAYDVEVVSDLAYLGVCAAERD